MRFNVKNRENKMNEIQCETEENVNEIQCETTEEENVNEIQCETR